MGAAAEDAILDSVISREINKRKRKTDAQE
jgi:hypothetical protein